jgi:hypothetical protein
MYSQKKKVPYIAALFALMAALLLPSASAYFYTIYTECSTFPCITGQPMNWTLEIFNNGMKRLEYVAAEIVDSTTDQTYAAWEIDFQPLSSDRGPVIPVGPTHKVNITIPSLIPKQHYGNKFNFHPCFTHVISDSQTLSKYGEYTFRHCYKEDDSITVLGCTNDIHCKSSEICGGNECKPLECGSCEYIKDHSCVKHECCMDDDCSYNSQCANHTCVAISCLESQYLFNRTCVDIQCEEHQIISNHTCKLLECLDDEGYSNHTCVPLTCKDDEFISNHYCSPLSCLESEYPGNHTCRPLECSNEQGYKNHECYDLECYPFQTMEDHSCKNNMRLILKLSVEVLIVILILTFIALDIYKYRHRGSFGKGSKGTSLKESLKPSSNSIEDELSKLRKK